MDPDDVQNTAFRTRSRGIYFWTGALEIYTEIQGAQAIGAEFTSFW
jgi:hypothetical protein